MHTLRPSDAAALRRRVDECYAEVIEAVDIVEKALEAKRFVQALEVERDRKESHEVQEGLQRKVRQVVRLRCTCSRSSLHQSAKNAILSHL